MELHPYIVSAQSVMGSLGRQSGLWSSIHPSLFKEFQISVRKVKYYRFVPLFAQATTSVHRSSNLKPMKLLGWLLYHNLHIYLMGWKFAPSGYTVWKLLHAQPGGYCMSGYVFVVQEYLRPVAHP